MLWYWAEIQEKVVIRANIHTTRGTAGVKRTGISLGEYSRQKSSPCAPRPPHERRAGAGKASRADGPIGCLGWLGL